MPLNDPSAPLIGGSAPRARLMVNGTPIYALLSFEVTNNGYYQADTYRASLVPGAQIDASAGLGTAWWCDDTTGSTQNPVMVAVQVNASSGWSTLISGRVDDLEYEPIAHTINLRGRDRSADLIEARTFEAFKNQTSSQIAQTLAARHGLTAQVTATTTLVERYYQIDHDKMTLGNFHTATSEWDLLTALAQQEGFEVFVRDTTLYFQPESAPSTNPWVLKLGYGQLAYIQANSVTVKLKRSLALARDIIVNVRSWNSRQKNAFTVTAKATGTKTTKAGANNTAAQSTTQTYDFMRPNMTQAQAQAFANQKLAELSAHERVVTIEMPGEVAITPQTGLQVTGSGTDFDITYYVTEITRSFSVAEGFTETVTAKNQSPKTVTFE